MARICEVCRKEVEAESALPTHRDSLEPDQRQMIHLLSFGYQVEDVAKAMKLNPRQVQARLALARRRLGYATLKQMLFTVGREVGASSRWRLVDG